MFMMLIAADVTRFNGVGDRLRVDACHWLTQLNGHRITIVISGMYVIDEWID